MPDKCRNCVSEGAIQKQGEKSERRMNDRHSVAMDGRMLMDDRVQDKTVQLGVCGGRASRVTVFDCRNLKMTVKPD